MKGPGGVIYCIVRLRHYVALAKRGLRELLVGPTPLGEFRLGTGVYGLYKLTVDVDSAAYNSAILIPRKCSLDRAEMAKM